MIGDGEQSLDLTRRVHLRRSFDAWAGTAADLGRLLTIFDAAAKERKGELDEKARKIREPEPKRGIVITTTKPVQVTPLPNFGKTVVTLQQGDDTFTGSISRVLPLVDPRQVSSLTARVDFGRADFAQLRLSNNDLFGARSRPTLEIESPYRSWAASSFATLSQEMAVACPRAAQAGRQGCWSLLILAVYMTLALAVYLATVGPHVSLAAPVTFCGTLLAAGFTWGVTVDNLRVRLFPPFELNTDGRYSGQRRLAWLAGTLIMIPIGVLINLMT